MLGRTLVRGLRDAGVGVENAPTGEAGLTALVERPAEVMILDVMLPGIDGFETCRRLRVAASRTPVLMLRGGGGVLRLDAGLKARDDDCLANPFSFLELVARVRAQVRRHERRRRETIRVGALQIAPPARTATRHA